MNIDYSQIITAEARQAQAQADLSVARQREAAAFLAATDWYVSRFAETGSPIPKEVQAERKAARACFD
jgi:2-oxo-4-hydroxy-4-carboxy--5-ureidoimidazoline (OHCU) decarboxylase